MSELLSDQEKEDLISLMEVYLGDYDIHDQVRELADLGDETGEDLGNEIEAASVYYHRIAKLYYVFTGKDFLCGHGYGSNYTGRVE